MKVMLGQKNTKQGMVKGGGALARMSHMILTRIVEL